MRTAANNKKEKPQYQCKDCSLSREWHEIAHDTGQPFLCKCDYRKEGKYSHFLDEPQCEHFIKRRDR